MSKHITSDARSLVKGSPVRPSREQVDMAFTISPHQKGDGISGDKHIIFLTETCPFKEGDVLKTNTFDYVRVWNIRHEEDFFDDHYEIYTSPVNDNGRPIQEVRWLQKSFSSMSMSIIDFSK